ncbi:MAG: 2OG-Fe dioxygenase family protein [Rhodospirillales bacterium]|nr:2OG-Fe dioxygenase family protein [Rhodospirillales bacterium]
MKPLVDAEARPPLALLSGQGFALLPAAEVRAWLLSHGSLADWDSFAASWDGMEQDRYMADGGRYRRRRHAVFAGQPGQALIRQPHQPHYQTRTYNRLNGGVERWFEPMTPAAAQSAALGTILAAARALFEAIAAPRAWTVELHQFRIEAGPDQSGKPTPEGMHRDGVDWVLVLMVRRRNIVSGTTTIHDLDGRQLGSFTLADPFDAAIVDDRRVYHGVTPVEAADPSQPAHRDVLVATFKAA